VWGGAAAAEFSEWGAAGEFVVVLNLHEAIGQYISKTHVNNIRYARGGKDYLFGNSLFTDTGIKNLGSHKF